jgi:hypothetical protein
MKPKIKVFKSKHIKGNYSVSNPSFILTNTNNIISSYQNQKKSNRAKTNSKKKNLLKNLIINHLYSEEKIIKK